MNAVSLIAEFVQSDLVRPLTKQPEWGRHRTSTVQLPAGREVAEG